MRRTITKNLTRMQQSFNRMEVDINQVFFVVRYFVFFTNTLFDVSPNQVVVDKVIFDPPVKVQMNIKSIAGFNVALTLRIFHRVSLRAQLNRPKSPRTALLRRINR